MSTVNYISSYSGAGFKIAHHAGVKAMEATLGLDGSYNLIASYGVSSGSIIQFVANVAGVSKVKKYAIEYTSEDVFYQDPTKFEGAIYAGCRLIGGKLYLYDQSKLIETLTRVVSKDDFDFWKDDPTKAPIYAVAVDLETAEPIAYNLQELSYIEAIMAVLASSSIPIFTKPISFDGKHLVDGGLRTHCATPLALSKYGKDANMCLSVFSRPQSIEHYKWDMPKEKIFGTAMFKLLGRIFEIVNLEISQSDERIGDEECQDLGIEHIKVFTEGIIGEGVYRTDRTSNQKWYLDGIEAFKEAFKNSNYDTGKQTNS